MKESKAHTCLTASEGRDATDKTDLHRYDLGKFLVSS
jgi:hypothetical protein